MGLLRFLWVFLKDDILLTCKSRHTFVDVELLRELDGQLQPL